MPALVVDDCRAMRAVLRQILRQLGFDVVEAADGREALDCIEQEGKPQYVLVDWNMPEMNGIDFIRVVRAQQQYRDLPIMMVTTETEMSQIARALAAGVNEIPPATNESALASRRACPGGLNPPARSCPGGVNPPARFRHCLELLRMR